MGGKQQYLGQNIHIQNTPNVQPNEKACNLK